MIKTHEGANQYEHSLNHALEFFSKAGSLFTKKKSFYPGEEGALSLFQKSWIVDELISFKLLMWLRNIRGGAGNRSGFRDCLRWVASSNPEWVSANLHLIPLYGRWDDLRSLFGTPLQDEAAEFWAEAINEGNVLAAKWAKRNDKPLQRAFEINEATLRKILSSIRKGHIVEAKMCAKKWNEIEYRKVPSVAMSRYTNAFNKHDAERFSSFKINVATGKENIKTEALFPHDCVRTIFNGDSEVGNLQFENLPKYYDVNDERVLVLCDTSASMHVRISGSMEAVHVSTGLALYCSNNMPKESPFWRKFIGFCSESKLVDWSKHTFASALSDRRVFDGAVGSTRIDLALKTILDTAKFFNLTNEQIPTTLLIVSDMQFTQGTMENTYSYRNSKNYNHNTEVERMMKEFKKEGYDVPKIVYWNLAGYAGSPSTKLAKNVGLVSGFSPSILKAVFEGKDFTPLGIMMRTLEDYEVVMPE